jgi:FlaA1/EpsC-like NDP-sugar epimerase
VTVSLESIDWHRFLARPRLAQPTEETKDALRKARILVTGAGGSIGAALARRLSNLKARQLVLLDHSDSRLWALQETLRKHGEDTARFVVGDVGDSGLLHELFADYAPDMIFHAAAFKHVPLLEKHPFAAVKNNLFGTETLASVAVSSGAHVVLVSTDKAVQPTSIMGATKRVAEHIVLAAGGSVVRLANVLASRESVVEVFAQQIAARIALTVTDPAARRYFITLDEAVDLLIAGSKKNEAHSLFVPALYKQHFVVDLAHFLVRELAPGSECGVEFTRLRPGDKEFEELWSSDETAGLVYQGSLLPIDAPRMNAAELKCILAQIRRGLERRDLPAILDHLCSPVPGYVPSTLLRSLATQASARTAL